MDAYESLATLHYFLKLFFLHHISSNKPGLIINVWTYFRIVTILFVFGYLTSYNLYIHFSGDMMSSLSPSVVVVDAVDCTLCYFEYLVDLVFVYKNRDKIYSYYNNYNGIDEVFKMKYNENIQKSVTILLAMLIPSWFIASVGQFSVWAASGGWISSATYSVAYFTFLVRLLTATDLIAQTMLIRLRLKSIIDHIEECASFTEDSAQRIITFRKLEGIPVKVMPIIKYRCEIAKSSSCYLLLIDQVKFLNDFFGVRVLMHCLYTLVEMITFVNIVVRVISGAMSAVMTSYILLVPNFLRVFNCVAILSSLVYYCEACCRESGNVLNAVDHFLVNKKTSEELASSLETLHKLVISRPIKFTAAGFFNLEWTLLLSLASMVITYALILVQSTQ